MWRALHLFLLLALAAALSACAPPTRHEPFADFPYRQQVYDIDFAWRALPAADAVRVSGVARNVRYAYMEDLELQLSLLDAGRNVLAREVFFFLPNQIPRDDTTPFDLTLRHPAPQGALLHFLYKYRAWGGDGDTLTWFNSFQADLATGTLLKD